MEMESLVHLPDGCLPRLWCVQDTLDQLVVVLSLRIDPLHSSHLCLTIGRWEREFNWSTGRLGKSCGQNLDSSLGDQ